jgi:alpha-beta hydrolase superfamily lysophospholipase
MTASASTLREWPVPEGTPTRGRLLLIHGFGEYCGRHAELAEKLAAAGYHVAAGDLRGHGNAQGQRGHIHRWREWVEDVDSWWRVLPEEGPPLFVLGHSMGGLVAIDWTLEHPERVKGLALSSPIFEMGFEPPAWRRKLAELVSRLFPILSQPSGIDPEGISSVPEEVERYKSDPLIHTVASARMFVSYQRAASRLQTLGPAVHVPTLVFFGRDDPIASVEAARRFASTNPDWIRIRSYPGGRHELFHETPAIREQVTADLISFLNEAAAA